MQANEPMDLFLLPRLVLDRSGRRLGHGEGHYDAFLKKYQTFAKDMPVDALVSLSGVIPISVVALDMM
ncbi:hypothetical protein CUMW_176090 [Citrus unshiu]|uniref:5-formyltetrahydrofolate cyclo-ligase n=2 Tax=Citrus TaxID=2706 RepID=A0A2H5PXB1_CITUN|nr:hypothetical protein CUMW_176090 [Citrus unshiu]